MHSSGARSGAWVTVNYCCAAYPQGALGPGDLIRIAVKGYSVVTSMQANPAPASCSIRTLAFDFLRPDFLWALESLTRCTSGLVLIGRGTGRQAFNEGQLRPGEQRKGGDRGGRSTSRSAIETVTGAGRGGMASPGAGAAAWFDSPWRAWWHLQGLSRPERNGARRSPALPRRRARWWTGQRSHRGHASQPQGGRCAEGVSLSPQGFLGHDPGVSLDSKPRFIAAERVVGFVPVRFCQWPRRPTAGWTCRSSIPRATKLTYTARPVASELDAKCRRTYLETSHVHGRDQEQRDARGIIVAGRFKRLPAGLLRRRLPRSVSDSHRRHEHGVMANIDLLEYGAGGSRRRT